MIVLIDADSLCYANAFAVQEKDDEGNIFVVEDGIKFLKAKLNKSIASIIEETDADDYKVFLTGKSNYRDDVTSTYKANRVGMNRPILLPEAREFLVDRHDAIVVEGMEADDAVCIEQTYCLKNELDSCIAGIDKDLDQQEGLHFRWALFSKPCVLYTISKWDGLLNLYRQALVGDKVDNIMYYHDKEGSGTFKKDYGLGLKTAERMFSNCIEEKDVYEDVLSCYLNHPKFIKKSTGKQCTEEDLHMNMQLLYMKRTMDDEWSIPL